MVKNFSPGRARFDAHVVVEVGEGSVFLSQPPHSPRFARLTDAGQRATASEASFSRNQGYPNLSLGSSSSS